MDNKSKSRSDFSALFQSSHSPESLSADSLPPQVFSCMDALSEAAQQAKLKKTPDMKTPLTHRSRYDPYNFIDKMATPFEESWRRDPKSSQSKDSSKSEVIGGKRPMPHCKACTDFKTWMELTAHPRRKMSRDEREKKECPLDSELLGRNTWSFLHSMAAYYPEKPSDEQQHNMKNFISLFSQFYPCHICASHLREDLKTNSPDTSSNVTLSDWFCRLHNRVNERLGKPEFDCKKVLERWRDGWEDKSCD